MKLRAHQFATGNWHAVDDDTYDGPGSLIGKGSTREEALDDLRDLIKDKHLLKDDLESILINKPRKEVLVRCLEYWLQDAEQIYRDSKTEDESAKMADQIGEAEELFHELTGKAYKE